MINKAKKIFSTIFLSFYVPLLFSIVFIGNKAHYLDYYKLNTLFDNWVMALISLPIIAIFFVLFIKMKKIEITTRNTIIGYAAIVVLFCVIAILNVKSCKSILLTSG